MVISNILIWMLICIPIGYLHILARPNRIYNNFMENFFGERGEKIELDYQAIGIRIRQFRKERGAYQTLSELSNQEPSNISHIERGATKLSLPTIVNIANALGVTVDDLLCDSLTEAKSAFEREASAILSDCTHQELQIITGTMRSLKEHLRKANFDE